MELSVNDHPVKFKINSGGDVSVMSLNTYENTLNVPALRSTTHKRRGVNGTLKCRGTFSAHTSYEGELHKFDHYVADPESNLLSRSMAEKMNLVKLNVQEV